MDGGLLEGCVLYFLPGQLAGCWMASSTENSDGEGAGDREDGKFRLGDIRLKGTHQGRKVKSWLDVQVWTLERGQTSRSRGVTDVICSNGSHRHTCDFLWSIGSTQGTANIGR